jgi:hypothetical protein
VVGWQEEQRQPGHVDNILLLIQFLIDDILDCIHLKNYPFLSIYVIDEYDKDRRYEADVR